MDVHRRLAAARSGSTEEIERCPAATLVLNGEGARAFLKVNAEQALAGANQLDALRSSGVALPPLGGIPILIKDLYYSTSKARRRPPAAAC